MLSLIAGLCLVAASTPARGCHLEVPAATALAVDRPGEGAPAPAASDEGLQHPGPQGGVAPAPAFEPGPWRARLADADLVARERAYDDLLERALADEAVAGAVREWARGADEVAWTARLMQRELERRGAAGAWRTFREEGLRGLRGMEERMERLRSELERDLQSWFDDRARDPRIGPERDLRRQGAEQRPDEDARREPRDGARSRTKRVEARQDMDGARVEVRMQGEDGREEVKTYTGRTLEEIYRAHPQLREDSELRIEMGGPGQFPGESWRGVDPREGREWRGMDPWGGVPRGQVRRDDMDRRDASSPAAPEGDGPLRRPDAGRRGEPRDWRDEGGPGAPQRGMLGIACTPVGADLRAKLGLQEDVGLVVDSVVEGTIASRIGLRAGDVVVELSGRSIRKREDVAEVLAERRAGEDLQVVIVDKDGKRRTLTHRN